MRIATMALTFFDTLFVSRQKSKTTKRNIAHTKRPKTNFFN